MNKNLGMLKLLITTRMNKLLLLLAGTATISIAATYISAKIINTELTLRFAIEAVGIITGFIVFLGVGIICMDLKMNKNKTEMLINRIGFSGTNSYLVKLLANFMTVTLAYLVLSIAVAIGYILMVNSFFGSGYGVMITVMHNESFLFSDLLPLYQPLLILRNILLLMCIGQLLTNASLMYLQGIKSKLSYLGLALALAGFVSDKFVIRTMEGTIRNYIVGTIILCILLIITLLSVVNSIKWTEKGIYKEGERI